MRVKTAEYAVSAVKRDQWPKDDRPCIAFAGRSNVGKSSLINRILGRKNLVRVSKTPGRTQTLNFFLINDEVYFVDLPGYGYAHVPLSVKKQWGPMINEFLEGSPGLRGIVHLMDIRHEPTRDDLALLDWLEEIAKPTIPVLTKSDKLSRNEIQKHVSMYVRETGLPRDAFTVFSSETGVGLDDLWGRIDAALANNG